MNINFELYHVFCVVAKCKNITRAAEQLHISQPAISKSIKSLEEQLGGTLFIRTKRGVFLTEEAKIDSDKISALYDAVAQDYLDMFYRPMSDPYNTLLFTRESTSWNSDYDYIFDQNLVAFCNKHQLFYFHQKLIVLHLRNQLYEQTLLYL